MHYKDVDCSKGAQTFANCTYDTVGFGNCSEHINDAGVICRKSRHAFACKILVVSYVLMETGFSIGGGALALTHSAYPTWLKPIVPEMFITISFWRHLVILLPKPSPEGTEIAMNVRKTRLKD